PLEGAALASFADNDETHAEPSEGADRDVRALVRGQPAHVDPEVTTLPLRDEGLNVDGRMHDIALPRVVAADARGDDLRVRDPTIDARREGAVGLAQPGEQLADRASERRRDLFL